MNLEFVWNLRFAGLVPRATRPQAQSGSWKLRHCSFYSDNSRHSSLGARHFSCSRPLRGTSRLFSPTRFSLFFAHFAMNSTQLQEPILGVPRVGFAPNFERGLSSIGTS